ncbi:protein ENDOSPERM DEFECTIVE 1-like [Tripterygium wilfordii]|uniref:protein ENDOSPERM DEFECTIVE 1-like n=1 Tax=Tripterygium wilfordii TaxID=458696 RepID=UPI0018F840C9|nr:protein ENDOSPERM DEFECTIVE 1-like [Tripterygium wilfordii]XP_038710538.1 protein ENDOSPERM DEFECTIVE 1-like [Tripterygium wilfordii]
MEETMVDVRAADVVAEGCNRTATTMAVAHPHPPRRPRVREVSSRFMSPVASFSSSGDLHLHALKSPLPNLNRQRSSSAQRQRPLDENSAVVDSTSETPIQRRQPSRAVIKLFKDNGGGGGRYGGNKVFTPSRPDTPTVTATASSTSSRLRPMLQRSTSSAAEKLLHSSGIGLSNTGNNLRSSMPEGAEMLPTVSGRLLTERNINKLNVTGGDSLKPSSSPCSRSLNFPSSTGENPTFHHSIKGSERPTSALSKSQPNSVKMAALSLPPVPPQAKLGIDAIPKKARKVSSHQEDVHSLRMLHNHYLQWRYANAKAEASMQAQKRGAESTLYSLVVKISDLYDLVKRKRAELGLLQRSKTLSKILETQMPYLEEWSAFEEDYVVSLSEAIQALLNASVQIPVGGNVRVDIREVEKALSSAAKLMETVMLNVQGFMPKAEEIEKLISELAKVTDGEKALIEESGSLLSKTYASQVEEWSARSQLIQLHQI